jgi:hypothetical protein
MTARGDRGAEIPLSVAIDTLRRGLAAEVRFLRRDIMRVIELSLREGKALARTRSGRWAYQFEISDSAGERFVDQDAMLVAPSTTVRASVTEVGQTSIVVEAEQRVDVEQRGWRLVLRPGMLLERLGEALERCADDPTFCATTALRALALRPTGPAPLSKPLEPPADLNESQRRAVARAWQHDLTVIWGPPGTGKTRVIADVIAGLCRAGERVLLTSTTNAAVDQAVEALRARLGSGEAVSILRVKGAAGRAEAPSPAALEQRRRLELRQSQAGQCRRLIDQVSASRGQQLLAFTAEGPLIGPAQLSELFPGRAHEVSRLPRESLVACLGPRLRRLEALTRGYQDRLRGPEASAGGAATLARAMVVAATLTSAHTVSALAAERFDAVVIDEASMARLPLVFHCAGLASKRAILVGDPRQLPPIFEAPDAIVHATLGRTVFDLGNRATPASDDSVLLDTQYRMHPAIGQLVSGLNYAGRLRSAAAGPAALQVLADEPFAGSPLVLVDLAGTNHSCERQGPWSRINRTSAAIAVRLALSASRATTSVAIITPYAAQARLVQGQVNAEDAGSAITCATVHRFQGAEADVVIIDLVDAPPLRPGVLLNEQSPGSAAAALLNVSLSRARAKLIVLADLSHFRSHGAGPVVELLRQLEPLAHVHRAAPRAGGPS